MSTIKLIAPLGLVGSTVVSKSGASYVIGGDRTVTVDTMDVAALMSIGFSVYKVMISSMTISAPVAPIWSQSSARSPRAMSLSPLLRSLHTRGSSRCE